MVKHLTKEKENCMWIKANYDCNRKGIHNAIKLRDFGGGGVILGNLVKVVEGKLVKG